MKTTNLVLAGFLPLAIPALGQNAENTERPNIVWFLTEDVSSHYLAHFNEGRGAATPNVERLAQHGITFTNAYSCAPVSSAARTTLITGCYAPSFEGSFHRAFGKKSMSDMPGNLNMFPAYLRSAGYYTCNAHKTDYNVKLDNTAWNEIEGTIESWTPHVGARQPFFFMRTTMTTHEGRVQFNQNAYLTEKTETSLDSVYLHPSLPDTRLMRYTYARFYDRITESDRELGEIIDILEQKGQLDNTFIFYFGDNGGSLPGTKGYTNDIGFHVPLVVYVPEKWKDRVAQAYGSSEDGLVSFMDFAPTVLKLAGVQIPKRMDGTPFLGTDVNMEHRVVYGYGDRYDEFYAFNRCIRDGKYRYARNYNPHHARSLFAYFRYKQLAFREWKDLYEEGKLTSEQQTFFQPMGAEELYDLEADPNELHNLATDPNYKDIVDSLKHQLNDNLVAKADLGFFPETIVLEQALPKMDVFGQQNKERIARFIEIADMQTAPYTPTVEAELRKALTSADEVERWWGLTTCAYFGSKSKGLEEEILNLLNDKRAFVGTRAMVAASVLGNRYDKATFMKVAAKCTRVQEALLILNDLAFMFESQLVSPFTIQKTELPVKNRFIDWRLSYLNSYPATDSWSNRWKNIYQEKADIPVSPGAPQPNAVFFESFVSGMGQFTIVHPSGSEMLPQTWQQQTRCGDICLRAYALKEGKPYASESWLVSPVIDLSQSSGCELAFDNAANFFTTPDDYTVKVRVASGEWENLPLENMATGNSWNFVQTTGNLSAYDGKQIQLAFVYKSTVTHAGAWDIKNVCVSRHASTGIGQIPSYHQKSVIYDLQGRKSVQNREGVYVVDGRKVYKNNSK